MEIMIKDLIKSLFGLSTQAATTKHVVITNSDLKRGFSASEEFLGNKSNSIEDDEILQALATFEEIVYGLSIIKDIFIELIPQNPIFSELENKVSSIRESIHDGELVLKEAKSLINDNKTIIFSDDSMSKIDCVLFMINLLSLDIVVLKEKIGANGGELALLSSNIRELASKTKLVSLPLKQA